MKKHERSCCKNPNRACGMCGSAGLGPHNLPELIAALGRGDEEGVAALRTAAEGCPACMLAAIMQSKLQRKPDIEDPGFSVQFDFKKEKDAFWKEVNSVRAAAGEGRW